MELSSKASHVATIIDTTTYRLQHVRSYLTFAIRELMRRINLIDEKKRAARYSAESGTGPSVFAACEPVARSFAHSLVHAGKCVPRRGFALMSVGARHGTGGVRASTRACPTETARATRTKRRKGSPRWARVRARGPLTRTCGQRKRQLQLGIATRSPPPRPSPYTTLQVRFHDARSSFPPLLSSRPHSMPPSLIIPLTYPFPPLLSLAVSLSRTRSRNPTVFLRLMSTLLSFLFTSANGHPVAIHLRVR